MKASNMQRAARFFTLVFIFVIASHGRPAVAGIVLDFSTDDGVSFSNSFEVNVGSSHNISVFLLQSPPDIALTSEGLVSWGFDVTRTSTGVGNLTFVAPSPDFDTENHQVITASGFELEFAQNSGSGVQGNSILLGTLQFNAITEGSSIVTINDRLIGSGLANASWNTSALNNLDEQIFGPGAAGTYQFTVNVTAVPEPGTLLFLGVGTTLMLLHRRRMPEIAERG